MKYIPKKYAKAILFLDDTKSIVTKTYINYIFKYTAGTTGTRENINYNTKQLKYNVASYLVGKHNMICI